MLEIHMNTLEERLTFKKVEIKEKVDNVEEGNV